MNQQILDMAKDTYRFIKEMSAEEKETCLKLQIEIVDIMANNGKLKFTLVDLNKTNLTPMIIAFFQIYNGYRVQKITDSIVEINWGNKI